jgi:hypothetical protein
MSVFYLVFVVAISFALGSVLTVVFFVILSIKRITMPNETDLTKEILYAFLKVMLFLLTAAVGAGMAAIIPADVAIESIEKGGEMVPAWGVCYFIALYYYENKVAQKFFRRELKTAQT